jgi:hypothetical protein
VRTMLSLSPHASSAGAREAYAALFPEGLTFTPTDVGQGARPSWHPLSLDHLRDGPPRRVQFDGDPTVSFLKMDLSS